jgi:chromate transporter
VATISGMRAPERSPIHDVFAAALRLGLTSFGGPVAHLGYFRHEYVERRGWLVEAAFADLVALCQLLPGPASTQLVIAVSTGRAGLLGGIAGWFGFTAPSAVVMIAFGLVASRADLASAGWVHGLNLAALAVVALAVLQMARRLAPDLPRRGIAVVATAISLLVVSPFTQLAVIVGGAFLGRLVIRAPPMGAALPPLAGVSRRAGTIALALFLVLLVGLPLLRPVGGQTVALLDAFYRSGALVFGGGHVVLPLLHSNVVDPGWVGESAFLSGYGAAQAVPGPLFTFAAYLGTVGSLPPNGVAGGLLCLAAIFLPGALLVVGAMPLWEWLRARPSFRASAMGTNAAVVGILAAALYTPIWTVAIRGVSDVVMALAGLLVLATGRVSPIVVVAALAIAGQLQAP